MEIQITLSSYLSFKKSKVTNFHRMVIPDYFAECTIVPTVYFPVQIMVTSIPVRMRVSHQSLMLRVILRIHSTSLKERNEQFT